MCLQSLYRPCGREGDRAYSSYMTYRYDSTLPIYAVRVKTNNETNIINTNLPHFWPPIITQTALSQPSDRN